MNMGNAARRHAWLAGVIALILSFSFAGCAGSPKPAPEPAVVPAPEPAPDLATLIGTKDTAALRKFFSNRAALDSPDVNGNYPLHNAVEQDAPDIVELILVLGAKVDPLDKQGRTPLRLAIDEGKANDAKILAQRGADLFAKDPSGTTAAEAAIAKGGDLLLAVFGGPNINAKSADGTTALMVAADRLSEKAVADLLGAGADPLAKDNSGRSALDFALLHPDRIEAGRIAETLVMRGVNPTIGNWSWFAQAIRAADYTAIRFDDGKTPLHMAVELKASGIVQFLLSRGANPNVRSSSGSTPLHDAIRSGWIEGASILLAGKADPNARDGFDNTPLHIALPVGKVQQGVELLLSKGADPSLKDRNGNTPLHVAVQVGYPVKVVEELLAAGAQANAANSEGDTPLVLSVRSQHIEYIAALLKAGGDIFATNLRAESAISLAITQASAESQASAAPRAAAGSSTGAAATGTGGANSAVGAAAPASSPSAPAAGNAASATADSSGSSSSTPGFAVLTALLSPANVIARDSQGNTPLAIAVNLKASPAVIDLIVAKGGDVNSRNNAGDTPLHLAVRQGLRIQGEELLASKAYIFAANAKGETPVSIGLTAAGGPLDWLFNSAVVAARDRNGDTILHHAARRNLASVLPFLGQKGVQIDARNADGMTALALAVEADASESVKALLAMGASASVRDAMGDTSLHAAMLWGATKSVPLLLDAGADPAARNFAGETPLHYAVKKRDLDGVAILLDHKAPLEARDNRGDTPLAVAARSGRTDIEAKLVASGADVEARNMGGKTPLLLAVEANDTAMAKTLVAAGGDILAVDASGVSPVPAAAAKSLPLLDVLLAPIAINRKDSEGRNALRVLVDASASVEAIELTIAKGAALDSRDRRSTTPLHAALTVGELPAVTLLASAGADLYAKDADGETPASLAIAKGGASLKALLAMPLSSALPSLVSTASRIKSLDPLGNGLLSYAALAGNEAAVDSLLAMGADKTLRNIFGETPSEVAAKRGNEALAAKLK